MLIYLPTPIPIVVQRSALFGVTAIQATCLSG